MANQSTDMGEGKPTLHHMNNSQSQRILWLIEELQIPYNLENHFRQTSGPKKGRSPEALFAIHPLGKAPQLVTAQGRVIVESSAIAKYLIDTYDTSGKFQGDSATGNDNIRDEILTSFAGTSMGTLMMFELFLDILVTQMPFFIRPLASMFRRGVQGSFTGPELKKNFAFLEHELGDQDYFMGKSPGRADFIIEFPMTLCVTRNYIDITQYPKLVKWIERYQARPAWKEGLNKGNGYDMNALFT